MRAVLPDVCVFVPLKPNDESRAEQSLISIDCSAMIDRWSGVNFSRDFSIVQLPISADDIRSVRSGSDAAPSLVHM